MFCGNRLNPGRQGVKYSVERGRPPWPKRPLDSGFTLLEILLVLALVAGAGFSLMVRLPLHYDSRNLAAASTRLMEELRDARQAAMAENVWYEVRFFPDTNTYQITRMGIRVKDIALPAGIKMLNRPPYLRFYATGIPDQGVTIALGTVNGKEQRKVIVAGVSGRIRTE